MYKVSDTYKAAYFMTEGAELVKVEFVYVENKKTLFNRKWIVYLSNVTDEMVEKWETASAVVNVVDFQRERNRIKKIAKKMLNQDYKNLP